MKINQRVWGPVGVMAAMAYYGYQYYQGHTAKKTIQNTGLSGTIMHNPAPVAPPIKPGETAPPKKQT